MTTNALAELLLLPPANLLAVAAVALWFGRVGRWLATVSLIMLLALALPLTARALTAALESGPDPTGPVPGAIVVLGGDVVLDGVTLRADPGPLSLDRMRSAAALARRTGLPILVTGGPVDRGTEPVASVMAQGLREDFAVPVRWVEPNAKDTAENARNAAAILGAEGIHAAYVVTQAWHMRRARIAFAATPLAMTAAPVRTDPAPGFWWSEFIPRPGAWLQSWYALHEWVGGAWYTVRHAPSG